MTKETEDHRVITTGGIFPVTYNECLAVRQAFDSDRPEPYIKFESGGFVVEIKYETIIGFMEPDA